MSAESAPLNVAGVFYDPALLPSGPASQEPGTLTGVHAQPLHVKKERLVIDPRTGHSVKHHEVPSWRQDVKQVGSYLWQGYDHLPDLLLPWGFFTFVMYAFSLLQATAPWIGLMALLLGIIVPISLLVLSQRTTFKALSYACLVATVSGFFNGEYAFYYYIQERGYYTRYREYSDIMPSDSALTTSDAAYVDFSNGTKVDVSRSVGYEWWGSTWCAAPIILTPEDPTSDVYLKADFWAVGKGCCGSRSSFNCGPVGNATVRGGLVVLDGAPEFVKDKSIPRYLAAARMSSEISGMLLPADYNPAFVKWGQTVETHLDEEWDNAVDYCLAVLGGLLLALVAFACMLPCVGIAIASVKPGETLFPHPRSASMMQFGIGAVAKPWRSHANLDSDFMHGRAYWCGEVYHDYVFHVANSHIFVGIVACHPLHPFTKVERALVATLVVLCTVFPVAAIEAAMGDQVLLQAVVAFVLIISFRVFLRRFLESVSEDNNSDDLESANAQVQREAKKRLAKEVGIFAAAFALVAVLIFLCVRIIQAQSDESVGTMLGQSCYCIAALFAADAILDLFRPMYVDAQFARSQRGKWCLGFFDRWMYERDASMWNPDYDVVYPAPGL